MISLSSRRITSTLSQSNQVASFTLQICGLKYIKPPPSYADVVFPADPKPRAVPKVPTLPDNVMPVKMPRFLGRMRWPELVHNNLIYKQYGLQAVYGGRLKICHFDVLKNIVTEKLNFKKHFFVWRVDSPWQSCFKKPIGFTLGGGKGSIHHFVTPVAPARIICEVGGYCEFEEIQPILTYMARLMPFKTRAISHELLIKEKEEEHRRKEQNLNPYTYEYVLKNKMINARNHARITHMRYFDKYLKA